MQRFSVTSPGRICLFGEHQDYLQLPVIPCAISLRVGIEAVARAGRTVHLDLPDIGESISFDLNAPLDYITERDYFRSAVNVMLRRGFTFADGIKGVVHGDIPINSGTSSSSALVAAWIALLARFSEQRKNLAPEEIAQLAHEAEVLEFNEPGGMMDHFATAYGGVLYIQFHPRPAVRVLNPALGTFVLGDSLEAKDTKSILSRVKDGVLGVMDKLTHLQENFLLQTVKLANLAGIGKMLSHQEWDLLRATIQNREITDQAAQLLSAEELDHRRLGALLFEHHKVLRDSLQISTAKIDRMLDAAMAAGALGGKINGSGGGGCMFAYAPDNTIQVAEAIEREGGRAYVVRVGGGTDIKSER